MSCLLFACVGLFLTAGCSTGRRPLTYVALNRPIGPIKAEGKPATVTFSRKGFYFLNAGFRPAPDVADYLRQAQEKSDCDVLKDVQVVFRVPWSPAGLTEFPWFCGIFGYHCIGTDFVKANYPPRRRRR